MIKIRSASIARPSGVSAGLLASTILASLSAWPAFAQDDRLAELERQIAALSQQVQELKAQQAAPAAATPPPGAFPAGAVVATEETGVPVALLPQVVKTPESPGVAGHPFYGALPEGRTTGAMATGNDKVRLAFSGQINRALNFIDDGLSSDLYQVDNENASSRFRFLGSTSPLNDTLALSAFEFEWPYNGSLDVSQLDQSVPSNINQDFNLRLLEVGFSNNDWGSVFIGQGWMASDGTAEIDLSGITTPFWVGQTFAYGGMLPTQSGADTDYVPRDEGAVPQPGDYDTEEEYEQALGDYSVASSNFANVFTLGNNLDGLSRLVRVRYNTPVFAGFQLSGSAATEDRYDVALRYAGETSWAKFAAAGSYWTDTSDSGYDSYTGSASMLLASEGSWWNGLSFTVSAATQELDQAERSPTTYFGKIGYGTNIWDVGRTAFALGYGRYDDFRVEDETMELFGVGFSQNLDALGTELYAGFWQTQFDNPDIDYNDMTTFQAGAMVRF